MALSNKYGSILLTTGNKSELAVGYCTIYGDMSGGLAVISYVPKTIPSTACRMAELHIRSGDDPPTNEESPHCRASIRPNLPGQPAALQGVGRYPGEIYRTAPVKKELLAQGFDAGTVKRVLCLVKNAEFKRRQAAPGLKVTDRAFGSGWRMPVASRSW